MVAQLKSLTQYFEQIFKKLQRPQRAYILPTAFGLATATLIVLLLLLAFVYSNNLVYAAVFFIASFCIQNMIRCAKNIEKLYVTNVSEVEVFAAQPSSCLIELENKGRWEIIDSQISSSVFVEQLQVPILKPKSHQSFSIMVLFAKRGWTKLPFLRIESLFPFQMFFSWKKVEFQKQILVYPELRGVSLFQMSESSQQLEHSDEFLNHEIYNGSQSYLRIDWKIFARVQQLMVRKYGSGSEINTDFTWEQTQYLLESEQRISQLALWIHECRQKNMEFSLQLPHCFYRRSAHLSHYHDCLKELATWTV